MGGKRGRPVGVREGAKDGFYKVKKVERQRAGRWFREENLQRE